MWKEFDEIQGELEDSVEGEIDSGEREAFEDKFYNSVTKAKSMIPQVHVPLQEAQPSLANQSINAIQQKKNAFAHHRDTKVRWHVGKMAAVSRYFHIYDTRQHVATFNR